MANRRDAEESPAQAPRIPTRAMAIRIAVFYALLGGLWILGSGWLLHHFVASGSLEALLETIKGWFYVVFTALLLGLALDRYFLTIRQSTQIIQASEERLNQALEGASQAVWEWNVKTDEVFYSPSWKTMLGFQPHELSNTLSEWESRVHPEDLPRVLEQIQHHLEGRTPFYSSEHRMLCKDGAYKWILDQGKVMSRTPDGKPLRVLGTHSDITQRKWAEKRIAESEERFRALFNCNPDGVIVVDLEGLRIMFGNGTFCRMLGYAPEELSRLSVTDIHPKESLPHVMAEFEQLAKNNKNFANEIPVLRKDGGVFFADISSADFETDGRKCVVGQFRDITERKLAEQRIRESEARYRALFDQAMDGIAIASIDGIHLNVNAAFAKMHGYDSPQEMEHLRLQDLDLPETEQLTQDRARRLLAGEELTFEVEHYRKDGSIFPLSVSCNVVDLEGTKWLLGFHRDISELKRAARLQALSAEVLRILNDPQAMQEATKRLLDAIKREIGVEAAGIRLMQENDFPYAVSDGFSKDFLASENSLAARTSEGSFCLDENGNLKLECTCGLVLSGKSDPDNALFTPGGSAWINETQAFLNAVAKPDPRLNPRNRCFHEGYESIALIPIHVERKIVGLLQLNDRRQNCFTVEMIRYLEGLAASFGVALIRLKEEQAVREAEQKFRGIFENAVEGIYQAAPSGTILSANPAMAAILGFRSSDDLLQCAGHTDQLWPDPVRREKFQRQMALNGVVTGFESQLQRRDGQPIWISSNVLAVRDDSGNAIRYEGLVEDITPRKQVEEALRASEKRFAGIFHSSPAAIGISRLKDGQFLDVNDAFLHLFGYLREEVIGHTSHELKLYDSPNRSQLMLRLQEQQNLQNIEIRGCRKSGAYRNLLASLQIVDLVGEQCILGILTDVTELRRAEAALEQSEARYRLVSENSSDVIWLFDLVANRFTYVSPSVERLRGFTVEEVMQQSMEEVLSPESYGFVAGYLPKRAAAYEAGDDSARSLSYEVFQLRKDGSLVPTEVVTTIIADKQRRVTHIQGVTRDITERKRLEAQIRQVQKLEAIGQLAGGIAHDFNNILAAIMMRLDMLKMKHSYSAELQQGLKDLDAEARRAADLTRQLLMFSRRSVLSVKPLDLNEVVTNLLKMLGRLIGEHIDLRFDGKAGLPSVAADAGMLDQVIMNLVVNARDAMPNGGRIAISTSVVHFDEDAIGEGSEQRAGDFLCLTVADTGCGMDEETLKRIFDPFFTTKELGKGTGLGLATVHGIVAQHNGWVKVESTPGQGTIFHVFLPAVAGGAEEIVPELGSSQMPGGKETLLVVEDDRGVRRLLVQMLRAFGYHVHEAGTGREALSIWQSHGSAVDLVLTDMVMPEGMTGLELIEQLRALKPGLKAIISSGYSSDIVQAGVPSRAEIGFLPKPYEMSALASLVREFLDRP
jgi:PAS domain S-box-containing protein